MLESVEAAWELIESTVSVAEARSTALHEAEGLFLSAPVHATGDSPPFDKALMDGYAVRAADVVGGRGRFSVVGEITAGRTWSGVLTPGTALRIMTGAPLPDGCDCVIPVEMTTPAGDIVEVETPNAKPEWNLARRGQAIRAGSQILPAGVALGPAQLGALAEMGHSRVSVFPRPTVSVVATGDELVPYDAVPGPGQIRNSNQLMLVSQVRRAGGTVVFSTIARDNRESLAAAIRSGLEADFLILSGGVSAGVLDLVPSVLGEAGCDEVFHGCKVKPGKPIWFGIQPASRSADGRPHWIFGLPGNPVSSMVCCELFVRAGLNRRRGLTPISPPMHTARLAVSHTSRDSRPTYFPAVIEETQAGLSARPLDWQGSFDLQTVALANGFVLFPAAGFREAGSAVDVLLV